MEKSTIYNLPEDGVINKWRAEIEKENLCDLLRKEQALAEKLKAECGDNGKHLPAHYRLAIEDRMDELYYNLNIKILNSGICAGMELQKILIGQDE